MLLSNYCIRHRTTILILIILIMITGVMAYVTLPRESAPELKIPFVQVFTGYEGASPSDVETLITQPIERKLKSLADVKEMTSVSFEGASMINLEFEPDYDIESALQKVRDRVDQSKGDLPGDLENDPLVKEISSSDMFPVMFVMISGDVGLVRLKQIAEDLQDEIEGVRGVLEAEIQGGLEREIRVEFSQDRLSAYNLSLAEIIQTVARNNVNIPGGSLDIGESKYSIKAPSEFHTPDEIEHLVVATRDGRPVYLSDIAVIRDTFKDRNSYSRLNGTESVAIKVTKRSGENLLEIASQIKGILDNWRQRLPAQVTLTVTSDSSKDVRMMVSDLENNIWSGLILVLSVILITLGYRNAIMVALAIPFSALICFFVIQTLGMTLNMVVLFSLILVLGNLVDNAIVIVENVYRHHVHEGRPLLEATMVGTSEVAWPVISSTATNAMAFVPLLFWPGIMGQFMGYLPKTVIIAQIASLFVALTINPTLCAIFVRPSHRDHKKTSDELDQPGPILRSYRIFLEWGLRYRLLSVCFFFMMLGACIYAFANSGLGVEMFPDTEPNRIVVSIEAPEGTNVSKTNEFANRAEQIITKYGNIQNVTTTVGGGNVNTAQITIDMVDRADRRPAAAVPGDRRIYHANSNDTMSALRQEMVGAIVGAIVKVDKQEEGPPVGAPINIEIAGDDYAVLAGLAEQLKERIRSVPGVVDLTDDYEAGLPELQFNINKERAALLGLDAFSIGQVLKAAVNGLKVGDYREAEDEYDITARLPEEQRASVTDILRLRIPDKAGNQVPLTSVAQVKMSSGLSSIKHIDQKRVITVMANVAKGFNNDAVLTEVQKAAEQISRMPGYTFSYTGENEEMQESKAFMAKSFIIALLLIALVLVTQFDSVVQPLIIMVSVILSLIGVFIGLLLLHEPFGVIMTGMAVISLAGVVVNNAIVLIDYTNLLRKRGIDCHTAIVQAGMTRFRPVLLTAITTVLGLVPMAFGVSFDFRKWQWDIGSESSQWWGPMSTAFIFGMMVATTLTLFVVPNCYSLIYDWAQWRRHKSRGEPEQVEGISETDGETEGEVIVEPEPPVPAGR